MRTTITATGDAPAALAWRRYEDLRLWRTWSPQIQGVEAAHEHLRGGLTGMVIGPLGLRVPFEVVSVDPEAMTWRWRVRLGPVRAALAHTVSSTGGDVAGPGCTTTLTIEAPAAAVLAYRPVAALALHRLVRA
ncbi:SRPBCC family protein [Terrabacter sp. NPDC000476]|uniref:SRPBCC family protein n=1 Tax=Terrabacter sp. NPDC000476 TaxID=3154258 RepID=UPI0033285840